MRRLLLVLTVTSVLAGCGLSGAIVVETGSPGVTPDYVYTYADGSCWADDQLYTPCPWSFAGGYGYHWTYQGLWYTHPDYVWEHRFNPPPRTWRHPPTVGPREYPRYRYVDPPTRTWRGTPPSHGGWRGRPH